MPELPEVETIRCCLAPKVTGQVVGKVRVKRGSRLLRDTVSGPALVRALIGRKIEAVGRRGKYLIFTLSSGDFLVIHLGMTGLIYAAAKTEPSPDHTHFRLELTDCSLILSDPRTFGRILYVESGKLAAHPALARLGPEPLDPAFNPAWLESRLAGRTAPIKALLLGQGLVAGIGNIYADEACFRARVLPFRPAGELSPLEIRALVKAIKAVIGKSIECRGTTIRDYQWDMGQSGDFGRRLKVYGREGKTCPRCQDKVNRMMVGGRSTFFCRGCQS